MEKEKIFRGIKSPRAIIGYFLKRNALHWSNDQKYLAMRWWAEMGYCMDWNNPKTYNEKLQWLKVHDHNPLYTTLVDKVKVKEYISKIIGEEHIIPTIGVWDNANDIDFEKLPKSFVLKCNHNSGGGMCICKDKSKIDQEKIRDGLARGLKSNYYIVSREWPYKDVPPRILAEKYMSNGDGRALNDYKVMCFDGVVKLIELHQNRFTSQHTQDFYDREWRKTSITQGSSFFDSSEKDTPRPECFDQMIEYSEMLTKGMPHCRVDWYVINGTLYFGEMTFYDGSGFEKFDSEEDDALIGSWINLQLAYDQQ